MQRNKRTIVPLRAHRGSEKVITISTNSHSSANLTKHSKTVVSSGFKNSNNNKKVIGVYFLGNFPVSPPPSWRKALAPHPKSHPQSQKNAYANCQLLFLPGGAIQNAVAYHRASQPTSAFFRRMTQLCLRGHLCAAVSVIPTLPGSTVLPNSLLQNFASPWSWSPRCWSFLLWFHLILHRPNLCTGEWLSGLWSHQELPRRLSPVTITAEGMLQRENSSPAASLQRDQAGNVLPLVEAWMKEARRGCLRGSLDSWRTDFWGNIYIYIYINDHIFASVSAETNT